MVIGRRDGLAWSALEASDSHDRARSRRMSAPFDEDSAKTARDAEVSGTATWQGWRVGGRSIERTGSAAGTVSRRGRGPAAVVTAGGPGTAPIPPPAYVPADPVGLHMPQDAAPGQPVVPESPPTSVGLVRGGALRPGCMRGGSPVPSSRSALAGEFDARHGSPWNLHRLPGYSKTLAWFRGN